MPYHLSILEFPATGKCYDSMGEPTGKCPTKDDYLAILWGGFYHDGLWFNTRLGHWIHLQKTSKENVSSF